MATPDIRIKHGLTDHHKTVKMVNRLGEGSFRALLRLWGWASHNRPKGILKGMNPEDIGIAAGWPDGQQLVDALCEVGFLDKYRNGVYKLHDWEENQPYVFYGPERSDKAKDAVSKRGNAAKLKPANGDNNLALSKTQIEIISKRDLDHLKHKLRSSPLPDPSPDPSPNPNPNPNPNPKEIVPPSQSEHRQAIKYFCDQYQERFKVKYAFDGGKDGDLVKRIVKHIGYDQFVKVVDSFLLSEDKWLVNEGGFTIGTLKSQLNKLLQNLNRPGGVNGSGTGSQFTAAGGIKPDSPNKYDGIAERSARRYQPATAEADSVPGVAETAEGKEPG